MQLIIIIIHVGLARLVFTVIYPYWLDVQVCKLISTCDDEKIDQILQIQPADLSIASRSKDKIYTIS